MIILRHKTFAEITQLPSAPQTLPSMSMPLNTQGQQGGFFKNAWGTAKDKWNGLSTNQKWAAGATGAALIGGALLLRNRKKRKEAEEELERERRR